MLLNGNITADSLNLDTTQMYGRGQIHVPAALLGTSLTGGGVHPTAVLDTILPCHISILPTERRAVLHDTGVGTQQPEEGKWNARWRSWLRHFATSRKVAGSIPDGVTTIFNDIILPAAQWPWV